MSGKLDTEEKKPTAWALLQDEKAAKRAFNRKLWLPFLFLLPIYAYWGLKIYAIFAMAAIPLAVLIFKNIIFKNKEIAILLTTLTLKYFYSLLILLGLTILFPGPALHPPLTLGLPSSGEFTQRVRKLYPEGTTHEQILQSLTWQNFSVQYSDKTKKYHAKYHYNPSFFCMRDWTISWDIDNENKIQNVKTHSGAACL